MQNVTPGIQQHLDPRDWKSHRFGLPLARWQALADRVVWITGAGTGFGRSIAVALAAAGARVVLSGRRRGKLLETCDEMRALGISPDRAVTLPLDITDAQAVAGAMVEIERHGQPLCGLVHSAALPQGCGGPSPLMSMEPERWDRLLRVNVTGAWLVTRAALPLTLVQGGARVLFLTSEAGWAFTPGFGPYNVSKSALNNLAASFAAECAARYPDVDVQINVLIAGEARTEMNQGSIESPYTIACMALTLLSHPPGGPNGCFFHRDGRHFGFAHAMPYPQPLLV
jgi:3-oxoacyl-[acyl-carrier protein] reductase